MLKLRGYTHQVFTFPADLPTASAFYTDFNHILPFLPHIKLVRSYGNDQFRVLYNTIELSLYHVRIFADLQVTYEAATQTLHVSPLSGYPPMRAMATVHSLTAQGYFSSRSIFHPHEDNHTTVDYDLRLDAQLPKPFGLSLIPDRVMEQIATNIAEWRIDEIASGFIQRSIHEYRQQIRLTVSPAAPARPARREVLLAARSLRARPVPASIPAEKNEAN